MKVLDPFAGYRLASGHPIFHFSLFVGSWVVPVYYPYTTPDGLPEFVTDCFGMLRWAHFFLIILSLFSTFSKIESAIEIEDINNDGKIDAEEVQDAENKRRHRDAIWKIFNRLAETIAVFAY